MLALNFALPNYAVQAAATGLASLDLLRRTQPDLILLDIKLPDTNGVFLYKPS